MLSPTMKGAWKLGRFAGVDAHIHWTFGLLVAWAAWAAWNSAGTITGAALGVVFLLGVFGSVLLHELGHALVARHYGIATRNILLTPIGGIAHLAGVPKSPRAELAIAAAGPAVNIIIAGLLAIVVVLGNAPIVGLLGGLMVANLSLALFNLLPAFPMDGGRVLRAWLAQRRGHRAATHIAVRVGKILAIAMGIVGLVYNPMLVLIAGFVWFAGAAEERSAELSTPVDVVGWPRTTGPWAARPFGLDSWGLSGVDRRPSPRVVVWVRDR